MKTITLKQIALEVFAVIFTLAGIFAVYVVLGKLENNGLGSLGVMKYGLFLMPVVLFCMGLFFNLCARKRRITQKKNVAEAASDRLIRCLSESKERIDRCGSGYSIEGWSDAEISMDLGIAIELAEAGKKVDKEYLRILFAPTGAIQDIAIHEGWGDRFLQLAEELDRSI